MDVRYCGCKVLWLWFVVAVERNSRGSLTYLQDLLCKIWSFSGSHTSGNPLTGRTSGANDISIQQFHAGPIIRTRTRLTIIRRASQRISIKSTRAAFTVRAFRIMLTDASPHIHATSGRVSITITRNASRKRPAMRRIPAISGLAALAKLSHVAGWASTFFHPRRQVIQVIRSAP